MIALEFLMFKLYKIKTQVRANEKTSFITSWRKSVEFGK